MLQSLSKRRWLRVMFVVCAALIGAFACARFVACRTVNDLGGVCISREVPDWAKAICPTALLPIEIVHIENATISNADCWRIAVLHEVENLSLVRCGVSARGYRALGTLSNLEYLNVSYTGLDADGLDALMRCRLLENINVSGGALSDDDISTLAALSRLKWLSVNDTDVSAEAIRKLQSAAPQLEVIELDGSRAAEELGDVVRR
ncbi:MAG: hypothetical protein AB7O26_18930 [Planctomycetaceae bacterium]